MHQSIELTAQELSSLDQIIKSKQAGESFITDIINVTPQIVTATIDIIGGDAQKAAAPNFITAIVPVVRVVTPVVVRVTPAIVGADSKASADMAQINAAMVDLVNAIPVEKLIELRQAQGKKK